jgi:ERCC4 domain
VRAEEIREKRRGRTERGRERRRISHYTDSLAVSHIHLHLTSIPGPAYFLPISCTIKSQLYPYIKTLLQSPSSLHPLPTSIPLLTERKGISDLFQSFASGRLYNQAEAMGKHYAHPCLLIEFHPDKSFNLQVALLGEMRGEEKGGKGRSGEECRTEDSLSSPTLHAHSLPYL